MTEHDWLTCADPQEMLEHLHPGIRPGRALRSFLHGHRDDRRLWLFGCGCCRQVGPLLTDNGWAAVEAVERWADAADELDGVAALRRAAQEDEVAARRRNRISAWVVARAVYSLTAAWLTAGVPAAGPAVAAVADDCAAGAEAAGRGWDKHRRAQADLLRCLVGNPFHPIAFAPSWRTPTTIAG